MNYKQAFDHKMRVDSTFEKVAEAIKNFEHRNFIGCSMSVTAGLWNGEISESAEIGYISEKRLPAEWLALIEHVKRQCNQSCVLPSVQTIDKECTCDD